MKYGLLFGLNYHRTPQAKLRGCINDVKNVSNFLKNKCHFDHVEVHTDDQPKPRTTAQGFLQELNDLANLTWKKNIELCWIHYSGHGCNVIDFSGDEKDRQDECIVPSDYDRAGVVPDDYIKKIFKNFNPKAKLIVVFDCCHSGTIGDLTYRYISNEKYTVENKIENKCDSPIILLSGCDDHQTSADAYNVMNRRTFTGALSSCLLMSLDSFGDLSKVNVFELLNKVRDELKKKKFRQIPQLCTSFIFDDTNQNLF
jgi:hypothetical protein